MPEREVDGARASSSCGATATAPAFAIECSSGTYVRSLIADLGDAYCLELRRTAIGPFDVADADAERLVPLDDALALPARASSWPATTRGAPAHGVAVAGRGRRRRRACVDDDGLIALAEPRADGTLKPVVGFRG